MKYILFYALLLFGTILNAQEDSPNQIDFLIEPQFIYHFGFEEVEEGSWGSYPKEAIGFNFKNSILFRKMFGMSISARYSRLGLDADAVESSLGNGNYMVPTQKRFSISAGAVFIPKFESKKLDFCLDFELGYVSYESLHLSNNMRTVKYEDINGLAIDFALGGLWHFSKLMAIKLSLGLGVEYLTFEGDIISNEDNTRLASGEYCAWYRI